MNVSIVIPNYNGEKYIIDCIASVYHQIDHKPNIIVIDNHSTDTSVPLIKTHYPDITLIENSENVGFAAAVNQGIRATNARYVILFNNDAFARDGFVEALVACMETDPEIFSAGAKMLRHSEPGIIDTAGDELTILGWAYKTGDGQPSDRYERQRRIFSACAGAAIYRRQVFEEIGYFDERFFAYLEDVDIGFRANLHGYKNVFCPAAEVEHIGSATSGSKYNDFKVRISARNNIWMLAKNYSKWMLVSNFIFIIIGFMIKAVFFICKGFGKAYLEGLIDGVRHISAIKNNQSEYKMKIFEIEKMLIISTAKYIRDKLIRLIGANVR